MKYCLLLITVFLLLACGKPFLKGKNNQMWIGKAYHKCQFNKCPYKGVGRSQELEKIWTYIGTTAQYGAYRVDSMHFRKPYWSYNKIDRKLFKYEIMVKVKLISTFRDGGTKHYQDVHGNNYYVDNRIGTKTKGRITNLYPEDKHAMEENVELVIVTDF